MTIILPDVELAWAAGFFEGEGCVTTAKKRPYLTLFVAQSGDTLELERFCAAVKMGAVYGPYDTRQGHQLKYKWQTTGQRAHAVMRQLEPYLTVNGPKWSKYVKLIEEGQVRPDQRTEHP